jgi:uncharacterized protein
MLRHAVAGGIRGYQLYVSPYKGFRCAYRAKFGRWSCSEYAKQLALRLGASSLFKGLPRQFARCKAAYLALVAARRERDEKKDKRHWLDACDCDSIEPCAQAMKGKSCESPLSCDATPCDCGS